MRQRTRGPVPESPKPVVADVDPPGEWETIDGVAYRRVVLCFIFRSGRGTRDVLLGLKLTGFGSGRVVAIGGKIDGSESALDAAVREVAEETGMPLAPSEVRDAGRITWSFPAQPGWNMAATLFTTDVTTDATTEGEDVEPVACEEIEPRWYAVDSIPWHTMWKDAPHWIPFLLDGKRVDARIIMAVDNEDVADAVVT